MDTLNHKARLPAGKQGFSVLEILIAMGIAIMTMSAVFLVSFGDQSTLLNGETSAEAMTKAQMLLEEVQALARQDFNLVNPQITTTDGIYQKSVLVETLPDFVTKKVTAFVTWPGSHERRLSTALPTLVTNLDNVHSPNTCDSVLQGNWSNANLTNPVDVGVAPSGNPVTEISVFNKKLYISTSDTNGHNDDFYVYDIAASSTNPTFLGSIDANTVTPGNNGVTVASTTSALYAYLANGYGANFTVCPERPSCSQMQVVNVTNPSAPSVVRSYKLPATSTPFVTGSGGQSVGNTLVYKDGYIYLGLTKTGSGPEFDILDVGGGGPPASPTNPIYKGGYSVGRGVNSILVKNTYAYVGTSDNARELLVLDVRDVTNPTLVGTFNAPGSNGFGAGNTLAVVGTKLYFGRNYVSNAPEFYLLTVSDPSTPSVLGSRDVGVSTSTQSVNGIVVRDYFAFVTMSGLFQIWNISNPSAITLLKSFDIAGTGANNVASDCEGNYLYVGSYKTSNDKGIIYVAYPGS